MQVLSRYFGWTFNEVEEMTMEQIYFALKIIEESSKDNEDDGQLGLDGNLHFSTVEQWQAWRSMR